MSHLFEIKPEPESIVIKRINTKIDFILKNNFASDIKTQAAFNSLETTKLTATNDPSRGIEQANLEKTRDIETLREPSQKKLPKSIMKYVQIALIATVLIGLVYYLAWT